MKIYLWTNERTLKKNTKKPKTRHKASTKFVQMKGHPFQPGYTNLIEMSICLFAVCHNYCFSQEFHSHGDLAKSCREGHLQRSRPVIIVGFLSCPMYCDARSRRFWMTSPRTRNIRTCCWAFDGGTASTCSNAIQTSFIRPSVCESNAQKKSVSKGSAGMLQWRATSF